MTRNRTITLLAAAVTLVAGCSGDDAAPADSGPPEPTTIEELDAEVQPAAEALLDAPALQVTTVWFDENGDHERTDWLDYRASGSFVTVTQTASSAGDVRNEMAWIQTDSTRWCASSGPTHYCEVENPQTNEPWAVRPPGPQDTNSAHLPISLDLKAMATQSVASGVARDDLDVTRQASPTGEVVWTVQTPMNEGTFDREWVIGPEGSLRSYSAGPWFGVFSRTDFDFLIVTDPEPIEPPTSDTTLDLGTLNIPPAVPLLEL